MTSLCIASLVEPSKDALDGKGLTLANVQATVSFLTELSKTKQLSEKKVFECQGNELLALHVAPIIQHHWLVGDVSINTFFRVQDVLS